MGRDKDRYEISAKRTLAIRKRRPRNVNLGICYVPSTSQTSQSDVFWTSMGLHCAICNFQCTGGLYNKHLGPIAYLYNARQLDDPKTCITAYSSSKAVSSMPSSNFDKCKSSTVSDFMTPNGFFNSTSPDSTVQSQRRLKHVTLRRLRCTWNIADSQVYIPRTSFTYGQCPLRRDLIAVLIPSHGMDFRRTWDGKRPLRSYK
ncbi:hypothetical protein DAPPUDRAFT_117578 [Daphnia pulex]|uniref:Uncharacterized protein n=1 Tax=Daphnia pulex TaxID=6669 RepID=E9HT59_DAPPU|nr:hypothetical protein DAPPUDRAFT_117578 [Daphnia pulex]|eukprot:EFX65072.1 hypothetical protein DAPPUDRAFT_117578 [Daphnia pulex]